MIKVTFRMGPVEFYDNIEQATAAINNMMNQGGAGVPTPWRIEEIDGKAGEDYKVIREFDCSWQATLTPRG